MKVDGNENGRYFSIKGYSKNGSRILVNTTKPYSGKVMLQPNTFLLEIHAVGQWYLSAK